MGTRSAPDQRLDDVFLEKAKVLLKKLESGDVTDGMQGLVNLNEERIQLLYSQIGKITRGLHNAIANLEIKTAKTVLKDTDDLKQEANGTHKRLRYVSEITLEAAHATMDLVDKSVPIATELGVESSKLRRELQKFHPAEVDAAEFQSVYRKIDRYLELVELKSADLNSNFTEITVTQGYQDLSGQMLNQVMATLVETETDLLDLLETADLMQHVSGIGSDPTDRSAESRSDDAVRPVADDVMNNQDEVDDLLSNLGF